MQDSPHTNAQAVVSGHASDPIFADPTVGRPGQLAVAGIVAAGVFVGAGGSVGPIWLVPFVPLAGVGALLAIRRPRTPIGWILIGLGWSFVILSASVQATAEQFVDGTVDAPSVVLAIAQGGGGPAAFFLFAVLAAVFPSGRLPAGRWGLLARAALGIALAVVIAGYFMPVISVDLASDGPYEPVRNPIGLLPDSVLWQLITPATAIIPILLVTFAGAVSLIVRVGRARGTERQQLRWLATSLALVVLGVAGGFVIAYFVPGSSESGLAWIPAMAGFTTVPMAVGVAVLRYRLYDIDRIVSRTIAYGVVTAILGLVFAGIVVGLQALLTRFTGGGSLAVVASTLVVASLFQPLRRRIQHAIDHRFNRARYDSELTVKGFAAQLRDEVDLGRLSGDLRAIIGSSVAPTSVGVWLRTDRP